MAAIHDLLAQVQDEALRARLEQEINRLSKTKKFLFISLEDGTFTFPDFDPGKMYSGMKLGKKYKLGELGIAYRREKK